LSLDVIVIEMTTDSFEENPVQCNTFSQGINLLTTCVHRCKHPSENEVITNYATLLRQAAYSVLFLCSSDIYFSATGTKI